MGLFGKVFTKIASFANPISSFLGAVSSGLDIVGTFASADTDAKNRIIAADNAKKQADADAATAYLNADILNSQIDALRTQEGERITDIRGQGAVASSDNIALAAASGMGSAGSDRARVLSIGQRTDRDVGRLQSSMNSQIDILQKQRSQQIVQAQAFTDQSTNYDTQYTQAVKAKKSWLNPFD